MMKYTCTGICLICLIISRVNGKPFSVEEQTAPPFDTMSIGDIAASDNFQIMEAPEEGGEEPVDPFESYDEFPFDMGRSSKVDPSDAPPQIPMGDAHNSTGHKRPINDNVDQDNSIDNGQDPEYPYDYDPNDQLALEGGMVPTVVLAPKEMFHLSSDLPPEVQATLVDEHDRFMVEAEGMQEDMTDSPTAFVMTMPNGTEILEPIDKAEEDVEEETEVEAVLSTIQSPTTLAPFLLVDIFGYPDNQTENIIGLDSQETSIAPNTGTTEIPTVDDSATTTEMPTTDVGPDINNIPTTTDDLAATDDPTTSDDPAATDSPSTTEILSTTNVPTTRDISATTGSEPRPNSQADIIETTDVPVTTEGPATSDAPNLSHVRASLDDDITTHDSASDIVAVTTENPTNQNELIEVATEIPTTYDDLAKSAETTVTTIGVADIEDTTTFIPSSNNDATTLESHFDADASEDQLEAVQEGSVQVESAPAESVQVETSQVESIQQEPSQNESVKSEPAPEESAQRHLVQEKPIPMEPPQIELAQQESVPMEPTEEVPAHEASVQLEPAQEESRQIEPVQEEAIIIDPPQEDSVQKDPIQEESIPLGLAQEGSVPMEPAQEVSVDEDPPQKDPIREGSTPMEPAEEVSTQESYVQFEPAQEESRQMEPDLEESVLTDPIPQDSVQKGPIQEGSVPMEPAQEGSVPMKATQEVSADEDSVELEPVQDDSVPTDSTQDDFVQVEAIQEESDPREPVEEESIEEVIVPELCSTDDPLGCSKTREDSDFEDLTAQNNIKVTLADVLLKNNTTVNPQGVDHQVVKKGEALLKEYPSDTIESSLNLEEDSIREIPAEYRLLRTITTTSTTTVGVITQILTTFSTCWMTAAMGMSICTGSMLNASGRRKRAPKWVTAQPLLDHNGQAVLFTPAIMATKASEYVEGSNDVTIHGTESDRSAFARFLLTYEKVETINVTSTITATVVGTGYETLRFTSDVMDPGCLPLEFLGSNAIGQC